MGKQLKHVLYEINHFILLSEKFFLNDYINDIKSKFTENNDRILFFENNRKSILLHTRTLLEFYLRKNENEKDKLNAIDFIDENQWSKVRKEIITEYNLYNHYKQILDTRLFHLLNKRDSFKEEEIPIAFLYLIIWTLCFTINFLIYLDNNDYEEKISVIKNILNVINKTKNNLFIQKEELFN